jgi:hypothetical protein
MIFVRETFSETSETAPILLGRELGKKKIIDAQSVRNADACERGSPGGGRRRGGGAAAGWRAVRRVSSVLLMGCARCAPGRDARVGVHRASRGSRVRALAARPEEPSPRRYGDPTVA